MARIAESLREILDVSVFVAGGNNLVTTLPLYLRQSVTRPANFNGSARLAHGNLAHTVSLIIGCNQQCGVLREVHGTAIRWTAPEVAMTSPVSVDAKVVAHAWLKEFIEITTSGNAHNFATKLFKPDGWFRDVLIFTWDNRTLHGHEKIVEYLEKNLTSAKITNVVLDETPAFCPAPFALPAFGQGIEFSFRFETPIAFGRGLARLLPTSPTEMKALSVFVMMDDLKGHEEAGPETGLYGGHTITWNE